MRTVLTWNEGIGQLLKELLEQAADGVDVSVLLKLKLALVYLCHQALDEAALAWFPADSTHRDTCR